MDGNFIAYSGNGGIRLVVVQGGSDVLLVENAVYPSWGPNGQLVYEKGGDLWIRSAIGSNRQLTNTVYRESTPSWSPSGDWIAFSSNETGHWDIWVIASTGGTPVQITESEFSEVGPSWSGDASQLLFMTRAAEDEVWMATNLPDFTVAIQQASWGAVKALFR